MEKTPYSGRKAQEASKGGRASRDVHGRLQQLMCCGADRELGPLPPWWYRQPQAASFILLLSHALVVLLLRWDALNFL
jgi:hypothetical protein